MRWIMNAWLASACSLTLGGALLVAQTPNKPAEQPAEQAAEQAAEQTAEKAAEQTAEKAAEPPDASEQQPPADGEEAPGARDDQSERDPSNDRRRGQDRRGQDRRGPLGGRGAPDGFGPGGFGPGGMGPGPRMMLSRLPLMLALDADNDGEISTSEIQGGVAALKKLDKNADGKLTTDELLPEGMPGPFGPGGPRGPLGPGGFDPEQMVERMMAADANGDGFIDQDEMPERMKTMMLGRGDTDKDGKLSKEELVKLVSQMGSRRGPGGLGPRRDGDAPRDGTDQPERPRRPRSE